MNRRDFLLKSGAAASLGLMARGALFGQPVSKPVNIAPGSGGPRPQPLMTGSSGPKILPSAQGTGGPPFQGPTPLTEFRPLRRNVGCFVGRGGTIGWLASSSALVAIDTQFPDTAGIFLKDMPGRGERRLDAVINTHYHADHTGGNSVFQPVSKVIVAHTSVPEAMSALAKHSPGLAAPALPSETFKDSWRRDFGDETIAARYFRPAHTNGDIVLHFEKANVVHTGDLVFNRLYPVIDRAVGGSFKGWIAVLEDMAKTYPSDATYIYGHGGQKFGSTGKHQDILIFRDYIAGLLAHVGKEIKAGTSREEIIKLTNLPGFPDFHVPLGPGNRLSANLGAAYDELVGS